MAVFKYRVYLNCYFKEGVDLLMIFNKTHLVSSFFMIVITCGLFVFSIISPSEYGEVDSYVLPSISLEHNHSIIITQRDLDIARTQMPSLYSDVYSFDDLRSAKLCMLDESHGLPWYFPLYGALCLPLKIIIGMMNVDQLMAFKLTNAAAFTIGLLIVNYTYRHKEKYIALMLLLVSPVWYYLNYIAAETLICSIVIIAFCMWNKNKYKTAILTISIGAMLNPAVIGFGIIMFLEFCYINYRANGIESVGFRELIRLAMCFIPSVIPLAVNYYYLGVMNPSAQGLFDVSGVFQRFMAYFFDLNIGVAEISIFVVILYFIALVLNVMRKNTHGIFLCLSVILTILFISFGKHINCGMWGCARYIFWIYPAVIFSIIDAFQNDYRRLCLAFECIIISAVITFAYNGGVKPHVYIEFSNVSKFILDRLPQIYVSFCNSTFNSRTNHIDGGYDLSGFSIYKDSKTNQVRRIMYCNTAENKDKIKNMVVSKDGDISNELKTNDDGGIYTINISRYSEVQYYTEGGWLSNLIKKLYQSRNASIDNVQIQKIKSGIISLDEQTIEEVYSLLENNNLTDSQYVSMLFKNFLRREYTVKDDTYWLSVIKRGKSRCDVLRDIFASYEFKLKADVD